MQSRTNGAIRVVCPACKWQGNRVYRQLDDLSGKAQGFGACPKCRTAVVRAVHKNHYGVRRAS